MPDVTSPDPLEGTLMPALRTEADARDLALPHLEAAILTAVDIMEGPDFGPKGQPLQGYKLRAARFITEYAVGRPGVTVTINGDPTAILEQCSNRMLALVAAGQIDGAKLLTMLPVPEPPPPDDAV